MQEIWNSILYSWVPYQTSFEEVYEVMMEHVTLRKFKESIGKLDTYCLWGLGLGREYSMWILKA